MTLLGGEPVERVGGVDEGDRDREYQSQIQQTEFYCEESRQRSGIAKEDIPSAQKLPLKGEWTVCTSGELLTTTVKPYVDDVNMNACVCLGATRWRANDTNRPGCRADESRSQMDMSWNQADDPRMWTDTLNVSDRAETDGISHGDDTGTYLTTGDARRIVCETDGLAGHADTSTGQTDAPSVEMDARISANEPESISIPREKAKPPDLPMGTTRGHPDEPDGCRNHPNTLSIPMDSHSVETDTQMAENETETVRTCRIE